MRDQLLYSPPMVHETPNYTPPQSDLYPLKHT